MVRAVRCGDWRMPRDACPALWLAEVEAITNWGPKKGYSAKLENKTEGELR
jgi:hypothetical protein